MEEENKKFIKESLTQLQVTESSTLFAILDGALIENLNNKLTELLKQDEYESLYIGTKYTHLHEVAPYLLKLNVNHPILEWWMENGWDKHWGILCTSATDLNSLSMHFKKFLTVKDHNKNEVLFRFYDPRVLSNFLLTCSDDNYLEIEGPVKHYCLVDKLSGFKILQKRTFVTKELVFS